MTTSRETDALNHPVLRRLIEEANTLSLADRITLLKGLLPGVVREISPREFEGLIAALRLKGERFYDASSHPGEGRESRRVMGDRDFEGR
jgi:hypothetical protein